MTINAAPLCTKPPTGEVLYELVALIEHRGDAYKSRHYVTSARNSTGDWYLYDDAKVLKVGGIACLYRGNRTVKQTCLTIVNAYLDSDCDTMYV